MRCTDFSISMPMTLRGQRFYLSPVLFSTGAGGLANARKRHSPTPLPQGTPKASRASQFGSSITGCAPGHCRYSPAGTPSNFYGLLQDTGTQKTLFEQPTVKTTARHPPAAFRVSTCRPASPLRLPIQAPRPGATGLFPDIFNNLVFIHGPRSLKYDSRRVILSKGHPFGKRSH